MFENTFRKAISAKDFEDRIEYHFDPLSSKAALIALLETEVANLQVHLNDYAGFHRFYDTATSFMLETLKTMSSSDIAKSNSVINSYALVFVDLLMLLRKLRGSYVLAVRSYPGPAYTLLRDVLERSVLLSTLFQGNIAYGDLMGVRSDDNPNGTMEELSNRRRNYRQKVERKILNTYFGGESGLNALSQVKIQKWKDLFDQETHGSYLSSSYASIDWFDPNGGLSILEDPSAPMSVMFMNRHYEVSWMPLRLLPNLQTSEYTFDDNWKIKWRILDDSFWQASKSLGQLGKDIGEVIIEFVEKKFPFSADAHWATTTFNGTNSR